MRISHRVLLPLHLDQNSLFGCVATIGKQIILCIKRHNDKDSNDDDGDKNNEKLIRLNRRVNGVRLNSSGSRLLLWHFKNSNVCCCARSACLEQNPINLAIMSVFVFRFEQRKRNEYQKSNYTKEEKKPMCRW